MDFSKLDLEGIQSIVFPILKSLLGVDVEGFAGDHAELFLLVGDGFEDIANLFTVAGEALADGRVSMEEVQAIIAASKNIPDAIDDIALFFGDEEETE